MHDPVISFRMLYVLRICNTIYSNQILNMRGCPPKGGGRWLWLFSDTFLGAKGTENGKKWKINGKTGLTDTFLAPQVSKILRNFRILAKSHLVLWKLKILLHRMPNKSVKPVDIGFFEICSKKHFSKIQIVRRYKLRSPPSIRSL